MLSVRSRLLEHSVHKRSPELFGEPVSGRQTFPPSDIPGALLSLHAAAPAQQRSAAVTCGHSCTLIRRAPPWLGLLRLMLGMNGVVVRGVAVSN